MRSRYYWVMALCILVSGCEQIIGAPPHRLWECPRVPEACSCGDNQWSPEIEEGCDDGNTENFDGCSADCKEEFVVFVVAGALHTCALTNHGAVKCWGDNRYGQLGIGNRENRGDAPNELTARDSTVSLGKSRAAIALAAGEFHTCALLDDGRVKCWGLNGIGQLGIGDSHNRGDGPNEMGDELPAVNLFGGISAKAISAGAYHTCALLEDKRVQCWGANGSGQLGLGDTIPRGNTQYPKESASVLVNLGKDVRQISAGGYFTCALLEDNSVRCWGQNTSGQLGLDNSFDLGDEPGEPGETFPSVILSDELGLRTISSGQAHVCAEYSADGLKCWGSNFQGQLGLGDTESRGSQQGQMASLPFLTVGVGPVKQLTAGHLHTCLVFAAGTIKCWGSNQYGQLGLGDANNRGDEPGEMGDDLPELSFGMKKVIMVAAGQTHTCALLHDGSVKCWGGNTYGQLGLGDTSNRGDKPEETGNALPSINLFSTSW